MLASYKISSVYKDKDLSVAFLSTPDGHVIKLDGVKEKGYFFLGGWEGDEYPIAEEVPDDDDDDDEGIRSRARTCGRQINLTCCMTFGPHNWQTSSQRMGCTMTLWTSTASTRAMAPCLRTTWTT